MATIVVFLLALGMAASAIGLFLYADLKARRDEVLLRLRAGDLPDAGMQAVHDRRNINPFLRGACHVLWRSGLEVEPDTVAKVLWVLGALIPMSLLILGPFHGLIMLGFLTAFGYGLLRRRAAQRRAKIVAQLPGFLEAALRVLQAGNSLDEAIALAATESSDPLKPLFQSVGRQVRLGAPLDQVLSETADIHRVRDIKVIALAASINRRYGGSLRNVFRSLITAIRSRDAAARELRALTAETRFSAVVLAVIPALLTTYIYFQNQEYYTVMWATTGGRITLIMGVALQIIGVFIIYRMMASTEDNA